jgi:outer membrane protein assembly factor BamE
MHKATPLICTPLILALTLSGCTHRVDIQQGNRITQAEFAQLVPGMSREQVRYLLGTPLLLDPFHADRWDYLFHLTTNQGSRSRYHIVVNFNRDRVTTIQHHGDPLPAEPFTAIEEQTLMSRDKAL